MNKRCTWRIGNIARAFWLVSGLTGLLNACSVDLGTRIVRKGVQNPKDYGYKRIMLLKLAR